MARILVVDDEPGIRRSVRRMLEREGHEISECADGAEARAALEKTSPDVLLTDLHMPNFDGPALERTLRTMPGVRPRVVVISGSPEELPEMASAFGAVATLLKPFTREELLAVVAIALGEQPGASPKG